MSDFSNSQVSAANLAKGERKNESVTERSIEACDQIRNIRKRLGLDEDEPQQPTRTCGEEQELRDQYEALEKLSSS